MKKRITSILLVLLMLLQMLPASVFAATVSGNEIDITDINLNNAFTVEKVTISGASVISAEESGSNTLDVVLAGDTDPGAKVTATFAGKGNLQLQVLSNVVTLSDGSGTANVELRAVRPNGQPVAGGRYTINYTTQKGTAYAVSGLAGDGYTVNGKATAYEGTAYKFKVDVAEGYNASAMTVAYACAGETHTLSCGSDGYYTIESITGDIEILVSGVVKKETFTPELTEGEGYTISSGDTPYKGEAYTFRVDVLEGYNGNAMVVKANGNPLEGDNGAYTIADPQDDVITVTVEGIQKKTVCTVTPPTGDGFTFTGDPTVYLGEEYTFAVAVDKFYDGTSMTVKVNGTALSDGNGDGRYTFTAEQVETVITVEGLVPKKTHAVTLQTGKGYALTPANDDGKVIDGEDYTFTATAKGGYTVTGVLVNGETIADAAGTYTVENVTEDIVISAAAQRVPLPERTINVSENNVVDIDDQSVLSYSSIRYAKAVDITVTGATVKEAYQESDSTTVYMILSWDTPDDASVSVKFGTQLGSNCSMSGTDGSLTLEDGGGSLTMELTGKYSSRSGKKMYTLVFFREDAPTAVPTRLIETDSKDVYVKNSLILPLDAYFEGASQYYLVEDGTLKELAGSDYTFTAGSETGTHTLVFAAGNNIGTSEYVTVTVEVKEVDCGVYINYVTSNGSLNYVQFADADGDLIEGVDATCDTETRTISVLLPQSVGASDKVTAIFNLTQNGENGKLPLLTTRLDTSGVQSGRWDYAGNVFKEKTTALSHGKGSVSFYYCNTGPSGAVTWKIEYKVFNNLPTLAEGMASAAEKTITAGETYELDLREIFTDVDSNDTLTYKVSVDGDVKEAEADYTFTTDVAKTYELVFTANDGKDDSTDTYTVTLTVENVSDTYDMAVSVPSELEPKFYISTVYGDDGVDQFGDAVTVVAGETADGMTAYTLRYPQNAAMISVRADGWGGMAFAAEANGNISLRPVKLNVVDYDDHAAESTKTVTYDRHTAATGENGWLLVAGKEYTFTAVPGSSELAKATENVTVEAGAAVYVHKIALGLNNPVTITVPKGATAQLYRYNNYYNNTEIKAKIVKDSADGTTTSYQFIADTKANGTSHIYRVAMEGKITKSGWLSWGQQNLTVTYSDADKAPDYRLDDYYGTGEMSAAVASEDGVLLNINGRNHLHLSAGESKKLKAYRVWEIIPISYNNYIISPDFTYTVVTGRDVVTLADTESKSAGEGDWKMLKAVKDGVAVVEVTYDAIDVRGGDYAGTYGASDPARTGLVVVQVGESNDTSVKFGIDCFSSIGTSHKDHVSYNANNAKAWDAEFDTLYFTGDSGEMTLTPTAGSAITEVAVSHDKGTSWTVLTGTDGAYTAKIVSGNNILRVKTTVGTAYQVVRGDKVTYTVTEVNGKSDGDGEVEVGETVRVTLNGLHSPIPKMAGIYNPGYSDNSAGYSSQHLNYSANGEAIYGKGAQYTFIATANYVDVTVPESGVVELTDGYIGLGNIGFSKFMDDGEESHRNTPDSGRPGGQTGTSYHTRSVLPEITVTAVDADLTVPVTGVKISETEKTVNVGEGFTLSATIEPENATVQTVEWKSSDTDVVLVTEDGKVTAVGVGEATVTATAGDYTAECTVTVEKIAVSKVILDRTEAELEIGKTLTLTAEVLPENATEKAVTWTTSDPAVATVSSGIVTAVGAGRVVITAEADGKTAECTVVVTKPQEENTDTSKAKVYLSVSDDAAFIKTPQSTVTALSELVVPYFDLDPYGLEEFELPRTDVDYGKPTMLHMYIYATEVLWCGVKPEEAGRGYLAEEELLGTNLLMLSGTPGSLTTDWFWNMNMNLNYYRNYAYPADGTGYGITADSIVLNDGDVITIGHFTDWSFHTDPSGVFNYIVADGSTVTASALQGKKPVLTVYRAGKDYGAGTNTPVQTKVDIYYAKADALTTGDVTAWTKLGTTDAKGRLAADISELEPGQYVLAVAGRKGTEHTEVITSAPGGILLTVLEDAAGKQVLQVIGLIDGIGTVTPDSAEKIAAVRAAYDALADEQKAAVTNYGRLEEAETELAALMKAKADRDAADAAAAKIEAIGAVTADSKAAIDAAKKAYNALTDEQKMLVPADMLQKLTDAETAYARLIASEADKQAAAKVQAKIAAIGTVTLEKEETIRAAREAFDRLTETQKALVTNKTDLTQAEVLLSVLRDEAAAKAVEKKIAAIGSVTLQREKAVKTARESYEKLTDAQKALVKNLDVLEAAEETLALLKLAGTDITEIYTATGKYLQQLDAPTVGAQNGEWRVIGLSRAGKAVDEAYYGSVKQYVAENIDKNGRLHPVKSTENSRLIVALTAIGKDVTDVDGYDLLKGLNDMAYIGEQGVNGTIWALIAFDSHGYEIPEGDVTREKLVEEILKKQNPDGGWSLGGVSDPDMTGMALQALAPYRDTDAAVKAAVEEALQYLSAAQNGDGTFFGSEGVTSESLAQVITALTALGIDPEADERFIKNGVSAVDALAMFFTEGGGFRHGLTGDRNTMATEQGYYALVSYFRLLQDKTALYDMSDVEIATAAKDQATADAVAAMIAEIGEVTKDSGEKIAAARTAYDALTDAQKALLPADAAAKLTGAEKAYAALVKTEEDTAAAQAVEQMIAEIGEVTKDSGEKIAAARAAYNTLTPVQKALVDNPEVLEAAEKTYAALIKAEADKAAAAAADSLIAEIGKVTKDSEEKIRAARAAYDALTEEQKKLVKRYEKLEAAEKELRELNATATVTFTLLGCYVHDDGEVHTLAQGNLQTWIAKKTYKIEPGATVKDVLETALALVEDLKLATDRLEE